MPQDFIWPFIFWLFAAATFVQLVVWWVVFGRLAHSPPPGSRSAKVPKGAGGETPIAIILCARNEADNLRRYLPSILTQQYAGAWEVIVVDDASEDETPAVLQFFLEKNARLRVVRISEKKHSGKKHALAQGITAAKFDNLLLTDADCEPASPHWLAQMAMVLGEKPETEIVLGYGPMRSLPPLPRSTPPPTPPLKGRGARHTLRLPSLSGEGSGVGLNNWSRFETTYTAIQYFSFALAGMPYMGVGRNLAFKKKVFERAGGFAAHWNLASGDDDLLVNAAADARNTAVCLHPDSFVFSESKKTWREWVRQKRRHLSAGRRYRPMHQFLLTLVSGSQVLHYFLFVVLLVGGFGMVSAVSLFFLRGFLVFFLYRKILSQLRESNLLSRVPMYDTLLAAYYGAFVPLFLIAHRDDAFRWK